MRLRAVKAVRHSSPIFGSMLVGVAIGLFAVGIQLSGDCGLSMGSSYCDVVRWANIWSTRTLAVGGLLIGVGLVSEWWLDNQDNRTEESAAVSDLH